LPLLAAKQRTPRELLSGPCVNWAVTQFRNRCGSSAGRTRTYNQPVDRADLNTTKNTWSKLKQVLRFLAAHTFGALRDAV